jgi:hypothetical protein
MVKIGNIVTYNKSKLNIPQFNIFGSLAEVTNTLPTLLVGYEETKQFYGELNFIDRKINERVFWTTTRVEDRHIFYKDLEDFIDLCERELINGFQYFFINPFELKPREIKRFIRKLKNNGGVFYQDKEMIYLLTNKFTYGFHVGIGDVFGITNRRAIKFLQQNGYIQVEDSVIEDSKKALEVIDYDPSQLLFLQENFTII